MVNRLIVSVRRLYLHLILDYEGDDLGEYGDFHAQGDPQGNEKEPNLPEVLLPIGRGPTRLLTIFVAFHQTQVDHGCEMYDASQCD